MKAYLTNFKLGDVGTIKKFLKVCMSIMKVLLIKNITH